MGARIEQGAHRLKHLLPEAFDDHNRKRSAPIEPTDGLSDAKRQRVDAQMPPPVEPAQPFQPPPLPAGPVSFAQLFTLTQEQGLKSFDVNVIPLNILQSIVVPLLVSIDKGKMDQAVNVCALRILRFLFLVAACLQQSAGDRSGTLSVYTTRASGRNHVTPK